MLSLRHPVFILCHKIFLPLIYSTASSQKPNPSQHMFPMGTYFSNRYRGKLLEDIKTKDPS